MKRLLIAAAISICLTGVSAMAQSLYLKGRVLDKANMKGVPGATVKVIGASNSAVTDTAGRFQLQGLRPGESVGLQLRNSPQFVATYYGALRAGLVIVPFNPLSVEREIAHILSTAQCSAVVTDSETAGEVVKAAAEAATPA